MDLDTGTFPQFATQAEFLAALQDPNLPSPYEQLHAPLPGDSGVVVMPGPPQIESGSTGDTGTSGKLKKTAVVAALEAVKHAVTELERKGKVYEHQLEEILAHQNMMAINMHESYEKRIAELKELEYFEKKIEETLQRREDDEDEDDTDDEDDEDEDDARLEASLEAKADPGLLAIIRHAFSHLLGTVKLTAKDLPWWPKEGEEWPVDSATKEKFIRLRWEESYAHEDNYLALQAIFKYIRAKGAEYSPAAAKALRAISDEDLRARF
ncbi:hypothetical protein F4604DRAFT_1265462 [Suillus subluteus]|nr:hypothetical protein F4604DRAFT_1265462 [Suillus subluteus]